MTVQESIAAALAQHQNWRAIGIYRAAVLALLTPDTG